MAEQGSGAIGFPAGPAAGGVALRWASRNARTLAPLVTLVAMIVFFGFVADNFLTLSNFRNVVTQVGAIAVAATGITFVLLCAEIDLSIATVATYAGMIAAFLYIGGEVNLVVASFSVDGGLVLFLVIAVAITALIGLINGAFVSYVGIPSFMMTLAISASPSGYRVTSMPGRRSTRCPAT